MRGKALRIQASRPFLHTTTEMDDDDRRVLSRVKALCQIAVADRGDIGSLRRTFFIFTSWVRVVLAKSTAGW